ncbi:anaerobic C4-dicarboxylate transporter [Corynebacterium kroppenstedtii]|uniref:anaerobic C4-dicarboxylate transporter n=1 Tax=Corynebacterium sp. PCR 32 TaxID=3351342 RepID=UPI0030A8CB8E
MLTLHILIVLGAIVLGARLGSVAIGLAGGLGVLLLGVTGVPVSKGQIPFDVISIIMSVISAIAAMQLAGGMDYLVHVAERFLRKNPKRVTYFAPIVTYVMTLLAGTGHTAFSTLPVIAEVAKEGNVRPSRPLAISVVASQIAITASPISAAVVLMASLMEPHGVSYLTILAVVIPSSFLAIFPAAFITNHLGRELNDDPIYHDRVAQGLVKPTTGRDDYVPTKTAQRSVWIFLTAIVAVMVYATLSSDQVGIITNPTLPRNEAIIALMLATATVITIVCKLPSAEILTTPVFKSGMSACICVMGVAWLGTTIIDAHLEKIKHVSGDILTDYPWMLAVVLFVAAALLYSQAATTKALMPAALAVGVSPVIAVASFVAVSSLFILPTYPTLLAAVEMDDTGTTRIGKYVFNHSFIVPGTVAITVAVGLGFVIGSLVI